VPKIRRKGLDILRKPFPVTLEDFDVLYPSLWKRFSVEQLATVCAFAREIRVLEILPFALYLFARVSSSTDALTELREVLLSEDLVMVCGIGHGRLLEMQRLHSLSFAFDFIASPGCLKDNACQDQQPSRRIWALHKKGKFATVNALEQILLIQDNMLKVCSECRASAYERHEEGMLRCVLFL
jgi:hypothetical protein